MVIPQDQVLETEMVINGQFYINTEDNAIVAIQFSYRLEERNETKKNQLIFGLSNEKTE